MLTQDNVDIVTGWYDSPSAIATAPLVTAGKKLAVILNAGTAHITNLSPYYVRVSFSNWHAGFSMGLPHNPPCDLPFRQARGVEDPSRAPRLP